MNLDLFSMHARVNARNHLEIAGCDAIALAREFGTPLYVYDDAHLRTRAAELRDAFRARWRNSLILYATKAYYSPYLARIFKEADLGIDVTSEGELEIARRVGLDPERIYLHGNNKTLAEIRAAFALGVTHVVVDNLDEIELLAQIADAMNVMPQVLLRLAPAIDPHTHRYMATGIAESKFGLPMQTGAAMQAVHRVAALAPRVQLVGLHVHIGSQVFELEPYRDAVRAVFDFADELRDAVGVELREIDLGGGWGVPYSDAQSSLAVATVAEAIVSEIENRKPLHRPQGQVSKIENPQLLFEPGRALVAQSAVALYTIGSIKEIAGVRTYVAVDGGMGDNVRPALYGAQYTARVANKMNDAPTQRVAIAGRYCEQGDLLIENVDLPCVAAGDLLAIPCAGAYQIPMSSNYNLIPRPAVIAVRDGNVRVIRRRETIDDMLRCEVDE
ncbi:MAG: diaminopimelate decarboxylase [Chloroflexi bacterium]|nr:diaminopimelate decarboxylase [Chloroflexota bacterium]